MSFLTLRENNTVLLLFTRVYKPAGLRHIKGFNHVALGWLIPERPEVMLLIEPAMQGVNFDFVHVEEILKEAIEVLEVDLKFTFTQKLFKEELQTCATFVQYFAGFDVGATLVQTLYDRLTEKSKAYLSKRGILEVRKWELKQQ